MKPPLKKGQSDDFQTPPQALIPLLPHLNKEWKIWECAAGEGNLVKALRKEGYQVVSSDILTGKDFLRWEPKQYDCIITNPPYSLKQEFLERAYLLGKPFAFLLPLTALETQKRQHFFGCCGLEVILFDKRIDFKTPNDTGGKSWFATAWFTNWLNIGKQLSFSSLTDTMPKCVPCDTTHL